MVGAQPVHLPRSRRIHKETHTAMTTTGFLSMSLSSVASTLKNFIATGDEIHLAHKFLELNKWTCSDTLSIDMAIGILKQNGLSYKQIREIWNVADRKGTGHLARDELTILIRLMGWVQAGKSVDTAFLLDREGPLPIIKGITDQVELETKKDIDFGAQSRESQASNSTARVQRTSFRASKQKADVLFQVMPITEDDLVDLERIFMALNPINGCLHKRDIMAFYMDTMPELAFDQLYKIMSVLRLSSAGDVDFSNLVVGFYIVKGLKGGTLSSIPTSPEIERLYIHLTQRMRSRSFETSGEMNSQSSSERSLESVRETELHEDVERDVEDLIKDIRKMKCISTSMSMIFKRKYEILPVELAQMWKDSDPTSEYLINEERLAVMERLIRQRLSKKLHTEVMPNISSPTARPLPPVPPQMQLNINPRPPQYRSRMYPTPLVAYNSIIDEITKSTRQLDQIIKDQERTHNDVCEVHAALEHEHLLTKLRERQLQDNLSRKEIELEETARQLEHANRVMAENQISLDECRAALIESNSLADRLQSTLNLQKRQISDYAETVFEVRSECKDLQHKLHKAEADKSEAILEASDLQQILTLKDTQITELHDRIAELTKKASKSFEQRDTGPDSLHIGLRKSALGVRAPTLFFNPPLSPSLSASISGPYRWNALDEHLAGTQKALDPLAQPQPQPPSLTLHKNHESDTPIQNFLRKRPPSLLVTPLLQLPKHSSADSRSLLTISDLLYDAEEEEDLADSKYYEQFLRDMDLLKSDVEIKGFISDVVSRLFMSVYGFEADDLALFGKLALIKDKCIDMEDFKHAVSLIRNKLKEKANSTITATTKHVYPTANSLEGSATPANPHYQHDLSPSSFHPPKMFGRMDQLEKVGIDDTEEAGKDAVFQGGLMGQGVLRFHIPKRSSQLVFAT